MTDQRSMKAFLTTKHTKATKVSDLDIFKLLNFVLFVTFVVKFSFSSTERRRHFIRKISRYSLAYCSRLVSTSSGTRFDLILA